MTKHDKKWNMKYEQLVDFKRRKGHCLVPYNYEQDKPLGQWVRNQRSFHKNNKIRLDRRTFLDKIGFAWKYDGTQTMNQHDKLWHQQYAKIVEFKRKNGHCLVKICYEQDKSLAHLVSTQRTSHINGKLRLDRKRLLDEIGFAWGAWKDDTQTMNQYDKLWYQLHAQLETEPAAQMVASTNKRDEATGSFSSLEEYIGRQEKDSEPSAVTSSAALIGSTSRKVVQEDDAHCQIPSCWKVFFPF
jgi:hypothetical protein